MEIIDVILIIIFLGPYLLIVLLRNWFDSKTINNIKVYKPIGKANCEKKYGRQVMFSKKRKRR